MLLYSVLCKCLFLLLVSIGSERIRLVEQVDHVIVVYGHLLFSINGDGENSIVEEEAVEVCFSPVQMTEGNVEQAIRIYMAYDMVESIAWDGCFESSPLSVSMLSCEGVGCGCAAV